LIICGCCCCYKIGDWLAGGCTEWYPWADFGSTASFFIWLGSGCLNGDLAAVTDEALVWTGAYAWWFCSTLFCCRIV